MTLEGFLARLSSCPLIASAQASPGSPLQEPVILDRLAQASVGQGVAVLRLQGIETISTVKQWFQGPVVGLIKRDYTDSPVYITPTLREVDELMAAGCEVIALDATPDRRPGGATLRQLVERIHHAGRLAWADCDSMESLVYAAQGGCDIFSTTLVGYTKRGAATDGPDLALLAEMVKAAPGPVIAEGRFQQPWQTAMALRIGAAGVVIGGSLNDPVKQTGWFLKGLPKTETVGAVDLGGTWLRFALVDGSMNLLEIRRTPQPQTRNERMEWIRQQVLDSGVARVGVSAGGTIDPKTGEVWEAKDFIPEYLGTVFRLEGVEMTALNDGLAAAWGHFCRPGNSAKRVASLALGTGVGAGLVNNGGILCGPRGEYPRWNDLPLPSGRTVEEVLGGLSLTSTPSSSQREEAEEAARFVLRSMDQLWMPDKIVITGGVGLSDWMRSSLEASPEPIRAAVEFGPAESGLLGGASLALNPQAT